MTKQLERHQALLLGWCWIAVVNAAVIIGTGVATTAKANVRLFVHLYDAGQLLAVGLLLAGAAAAWQRWGSARLRHWLRATLFTAAAGLSVLVVREDLEGIAETFAGETQAAFVAGLLAATVGCTVPLAHAVGVLIAKPWWRWAAIVCSATLAVVNGIMLERLYPGLHLVATFNAAMLAAGALEGVQLPAWSSSRGPRVVAGVSCAAASLLAAWTLVVRPSSAVAERLFALPSSALAPFVAEVQSMLAGPDDIASIAGEWFHDRRTHADVPPTGQRVLPQDGVVILLVVDCLRADLVNDDKYASALPSMHRMRREAHSFANARAPGSATAQSVTAIFTGRHYSALYWSNRPGAGKVLPHRDTSTKFTERLTAAGVTTVNFPALSVLVNELGMVGGFAEEHRPPRPRGSAKWLIDSILDRLNRADGEPLFIYAHFMEAHAPYNRGGKKGTPFDRYLREVQIIDREIGRLLDGLSDSRFAHRAAVLLTGDHGEAFGEHNTKYHASTVYEELIRVPLLVKMPGGRAQTLTQPITLVDIGPTVLDLFGQPTPGSFLGESLAPLLRGEQAKLTRPIATESGHLKRAMVFPDNTKIIHDTRRDTVELYDLNADPEELRTVYVKGEDASDIRLRKLKAFFNAHVFRKPGYKTPTRR